MVCQCNKTYLGIALVLLIVEIGIAVFLTSGFIRHTFGDYLVVILVYAVIRGFTNSNIKAAALVSLSIAFGVELLQLTPILEILHLQQHTLARVVFGTHFSFSDLAAYSLGIASVLIIEYKLWKEYKYL